ncbi:MAG: aspartate aminotransferase family protein [Streptosporangiaceae bacterium]|nr:aspartate aminotransferase family protein [Streptosporangiaceae bacterium]MBV9853026.1 aspartate aminotransferase family protein [Streptosporangiaceae bacterium]
MDFDLRGELAAVHGQGYELQSRFLNPQLPRTLHTIGFDKVYERAEGAYLYDTDGNSYADFLAGFGVFAAGRNHPVIRKALHDALDAGLADWTQFDCPPISGLLAERLLARAPGLDRVFFCNSGTEAVESALKFARYATGRGRVIYCDHAFHGLTTGSLSVNGSAEFRSGFGPLLPDAPIQLGDLDALEAELRKGDVAALIVEPVQGKGVHMPPPGFLTAAASMLHDHGALLICDEVQTGLGRTGKFFAYQHEDVRPDIVTLAKALSGGYVPVGAMLATAPVFEKVYSSMDRVMVHSTTFKGGVLAMAAGLASLAVIENEGLVENAARTGEALRGALLELAGRYDVLAEVRGKGLMIGLEFGKPRSVRARASWNMLQKARVGLFAQMVVVALFQRHRVLTQVSGDHMEVIKLIPPLMIGDAEVKLFAGALADVMDDASRGTGLMWDFGRTLVKQAMHP